MSRMNKSERKVLEKSIYDLNRFLKWINRDNVAINTGHGPIEKRCGSPLQYVGNALERLTELHAKII